MSVTIWHNPRCSKSRATLAILEERGLTPSIRLYLDDAPSAAEIESVLMMLDASPREIMRVGEDEFKENNLGDPALDREALIGAMAAHPRLIERPIVIAGERAAMGRPPEAVIEIL